MAKYCPKCGEKLDGNPKFCPECGNKLIKKKTLITNKEDFIPIAEKSMEETNKNEQLKEKIFYGQKTNSTMKKILIGVAALTIFIIFLGIVTHQPQQSSTYIPQQYNQRTPLDWYYITTQDCSGAIDYYFIDGQKTYTFQVSEYASLWKIKIAGASTGNMNVKIYYGYGIDSNHLYDTISTSYTSYEKEYDNEFIGSGESPSFTIFNQGSYIFVTLIQYTDFAGLSPPCGSYRYVGT